MDTGASLEGNLWVKLMKKRAGQMKLCCKELLQIIIAQTGNATFSRMVLGGGMIAFSSSGVMR